MSRLTPSRRPGVPHQSSSHAAWTMDGCASCRRGRRDVRSGRGLGERLEVDRLGVGAPLARRLCRGARVAGVPGRALQPAAPLAAQVCDEEAARICELRHRTGWSPRRLADEPEITRPHSTVHQVLRRGGCARRPAPARRRGLRYEWPCPGQLLHMDVKKLAKFTEPGHAVTGAVSSSSARTTASTRRKGYSRRRALDGTGVDGPLRRA